MIEEPETIEKPIEIQPKKKITMRQRTIIRNLASCVSFQPFHDFLNMRLVHSKIKGHIDSSEMYSRLIFSKKKVTDLTKPPQVSSFEDYFRISKSLLSQKDDNYKLYKELILSPMVNLRIPEQTNLATDLEIDWEKTKFDFQTDTTLGIDEIYVQVVESSSDDYDQIAENMLGIMYHQNKEHFGNFWSSDGSQTKDDNDFVLFSSRIEKSEVLLMDRVDILFHVEKCHVYPNNIYHSKKIRLSIGYVEGEWELKKEVDLSGMDFYLRKGYIPIELDEHVFCRYILVEFLGKPCIQEMDNLYYLSVSRINFYGRMYNLLECQEIAKRLNNFYTKNEQKKIELDNFIRTRILKHFGENSNTESTLELFRNYQIKGDLLNVNKELYQQSLKISNESRLEMWYDNLSLRNSDYGFKFLVQDKELFKTVVNRKQNERHGSFSRMETKVLFYLLNFNTETGENLNVIRTEAVHNFQTQIGPLMTRVFTRFQESGIENKYIFSAPGCYNQEYYENSKLLTETANGILQHVTMLNGRSYTEELPVFIQRYLYIQYCMKTQINN